MAQVIIHPGQLNRLLPVMKHDTLPSETSEHTRTDVLVANVWASRLDADGTEEVEGKEIAVRRARYIVRFSLDLLRNGSDYFIREAEADYYIKSVSLTGQGRNRFLELKCTSRGND